MGVESLWHVGAYPGVLIAAVYNSRINPCLFKLFSQFTQIPSPQLQESPRDVQLRALFDRNPRPMAEAIARRLTLTRSQNVNNYFPQLALHTDPDQSAGPSTAGVGRGRNGFLDIFIRSIIHVRRGRVVAIELKYVSIEAILRARGTLNKPSWTQIDREAGYLDKKSTKELLDVKYRYWAKSTVEGGKATIDTIASGAADVPQKKKGVQDQRIKVEEDPRNAEDVIGVVMCGVGRRIVTMIVEPTSQTTKYKFLAVPGWEEQFEGCKE